MLLAISLKLCTHRSNICLRGLPHYKQLNFGAGRDWSGATAAPLMGITQAGDKKNVALKSASSR